MTTKEIIFETAVDLFSKNGYSGTSIRDITKIVGIRESSLYKHFKSKEEILVSIFEYFISEYNKPELSDDKLTEILQKTDIEQFLTIGIKQFFEQVEKPIMERIFRILIIEQYRVVKAKELLLVELIEKPIGFYTKVFDYKINQGQIKEFSSNKLAIELHYPIFALVYEYSLKKSYGEDVSTIKKMINEHLTFFCNQIKL
jgi:AcrR family transcriptional regulator